MERVVFPFPHLTTVACSNQPSRISLNDAITYAVQHYGKGGASLFGVGILGAATSPVAVLSMMFITSSGQCHGKDGA